MLSLSETFAVLTMVMVGGLGTLFGPVVGAILLTFLSEGLRFLEDFVKIDIRFVIYGGLLMLTVLFMRNGIVGLFREKIRPAIKAIRTPPTKAKGRLIKARRTFR